ncbi:uncharacterized protein LOC132284809 [Cornus florida]|uniref:uncharacterized protein LOC132284809 n=1 Tax=Cornus florida TaxID=4283 RepID=UPI00289D620A|nr:uncharacterized protein LOC132284809 [Cornus florida]
MDPPPLPPHPATTTQLCNPDSANSSPRTRPTDTWDEPLPPVPGAKLRMMCSYGGHIVPRPHDKSLCYVGGDTRMVVIDRHSSLSSLSTRISRTLLNGRHFTLKYQLPNEDLDSLISVTTDEDLDNMVEEYERTTSNSTPKSSRLRLFLFLAKPETSTSMGSLLDDAKSETWFVDALNGAVSLPRGLSDSAVADCLLELDGAVNADSCTDHFEPQNESLGGEKIVKNAQDVHSTMSDSPMVETTSSLGSSSSSPSMSNLPPIRVRSDQEGGARLQDQMVGLNERLSQMGIASNVVIKQDHGHGLVVLSAPPPLPTVIGQTYTMEANVTVNSGAPPTHEHSNRLFSDDERSDQGAPTGYRKPPLPLQPVQRKLGDAYNLPSPESKHAGGFNLPSPDSVASDSSIASGTSLSKHAMYHDPTHAATRENRAPTSQIDPKSGVLDPSSQIQMQQVHDSVFMQPPQQNQQQFVHAGTHYITHPAAAGTVPISSYYPMYAPSSQQQLQPQMDQQYPMYFVPVSQTQVTQPFNLSVQPNIADATVVASSRPAYKESVPPIYPTKTGISNEPELAASVYRTGAMATTPPMVQVPSNQYHHQQQQQYVGLSQMHHPSQPIAAASANYGYEYAHPTFEHEQMYYAQHPATPLPTQNQTMNPAAAVMLSQASAQLPADNTNQQTRTS